MTTTQAIETFKLSLVPTGLFSGKMPKGNDLEWVKANKPAIIAELTAMRDATKAAKEAKEAKVVAEKAAELNALMSGETMITPYYRDGEYLSGYSVSGQAAELLAKLGLAKCVSGWGYEVDDKLITAIGATFSYQQAVEFSKPAVEAKAAKVADKAAARQTIFDEAKTTGTKKVLRQWMSDCHSENEDCSFDTNYEWAMPDGSTATSWSHCW